MPSNIVKSFSKKTGKSEAEVEKLWQKAKQSAKKQGRKESDPKFYNLVTGILKKMLKLEKKLLTFGEFLITERTYKYSNTQIILPKDLSKKIIDFGKSIPDDEIYTDENDDSYGREENSHITLRYGTDVDNSMRLQGMKKLFPLNISLEKISAFEAENYDVLKISIDSPDLIKANKEIGKLIDFPGETFKDYQPHSTIAYLKKGNIKKYIGDKRFENEKFKADSFVLVNRMGKTIKI